MAWLAGSRSKLNYACKAKILSCSLPVLLCVSVNHRAQLKLHFQAFHFTTHGRSEDRWKVTTRLGAESNDGLLYPDLLQHFNISKCC